MQPRVIDQDAPKRVCYDREKMSPVAPFGRPTVSQTQIEFIDERRRLQRVAGSVPKDYDCAIDSLAPYNGDQSTCLKSQEGVSPAGLEP
jgi:hypothetical protein